MTLLDAREYDVERARKKKVRLISMISLLILVLLTGWLLRYWPEKRIVGHFFEALQKQDYKTAYGIWMHDPDWAQHPQQHPKYPFNEFYRDWGPGGEWGLIKSEQVYGASTCPGPGSGVVVDVIVNGRAEHAQVWVEKAD